MPSHCDVKRDLHYLIKPASLANLSFETVDTVYCDSHDCDYPYTLIDDAKWVKCRDGKCTDSKCCEKCEILFPLHTNIAPLV